MHLRPATPEDAEATAALARHAFCAAFAHLYDPADLAAFLDEHKTPAGFARIIADPLNRVMLAEAEGSLVGYCVMRLDSDYARHSDATDAMALQQLYTDPARTGQGIGDALARWALGEARERGKDAVQLSVWSENHGAQRFYARYGFAKIADISFWVGRHRDDEFLLELRLRSPEITSV